MSLQFSNFLPTLLLLVCQHMEITEAQSFSVTQTPSSLTVVEGTDLTMECKIYMPNKRWFITWYVNRTGGEKTSINKNHTSIDTNINDNWSRATLKKVDVTDSGLYVCQVGDLASFYISSNGTQVTVNELTNLMVNQTPGLIVEKEGTDVTIECSFRTVRNYSTMYVRWRKDGQNLTLERDSLKISHDLEKGFASLTLKNTKVNDSGSYVCEVGSWTRNLLGSGPPSRVDIKVQEKKQSLLNDRTKGDEAGAGAGAGTGVGPGVGAGVGAGGGVLLALLIGIFVWKKKQKSQGTPVATSEPESVSNTQTRIHPPLVSQASDVTYADLHFNKRDLKPDAEVIYAEVKSGRK